MAASLHNVPDKDNKNVPYSEYAFLYKAMRGRKMSQNERRKQFLEAIKESRGCCFDKNRKLETIFDEENDCEEGNELMEVDKKITARKKKKFQNLLTYTEWFFEVPDDLEENWLVKLCPFGHRSLVVAKQHKTLHFSRIGKLMYKFSSFLPGGSPSNTKSNRVTVLDCIFDTSINCYYVLDVIAWNDTFFNFKKCDTEFRFYWLKTKFEENPEYSFPSSSSSHKHVFKLIDYIPAVPNLISDKLNEILTMDGEMSVSVDGILFYHKHTDYVSGYTPLVTWLKPYMLPEMLNVDIHPKYESMKPANYTSLTEYLRKIPRFNKMYGIFVKDEMDIEEQDKSE